MGKNQKQKLTIQQRLPLILAFAIPVFVMLGVCAGKGIWPFGHMSFLRTDLYHQYCPFYTDLIRRLQSGQSLTYAWDIGLGSNYLALAAYYLVCPTNLLLLIVPESFVIEFMTIMIILKIGLCGYTMAKYLSVKHNTRSYGIVFFGIAYALCGYMAAYSWNIMWLDVLALAPLVLLGVEKLVKEDKPILYCVTLALSIFTNYYLSIMLCIFLVLYFLCLIVMLPTQSFKAYLKKFARFAFYSIIAAGMAAIFLLPAIYALGSTASADSTFPTTFKTYFSMIEQLAKQLAFIEVETGLDHWPNIYCGILPLLVLPLYYVNSKVSAKDKIVKTVLILFMLISFSTNVLNFIWHGLHYPNSLPCRQSYLYTILLLSMAYEGLEGAKDLKKGKIVGAFWGVAAFIFICDRVVKEDELAKSSIYASLAFLGMYALILYLYNTKKLKRVIAFTIALSLFVVELGINTAITSVRITDRDVYTLEKDSYQELLSQIEKNDFYRVEKKSLRTKNDGAWNGYCSASIFSSTTNANVSNFYKKIGLNGAVNAYSFTGNTPFTSSILSVKYLLANEDLAESTMYSLQNIIEGSRLYKNNYTLSLGFMMPGDITNTFNTLPSNPADAQNEFANLLVKEDINLLEQIPGNTNGEEFALTVNERTHVYVHVNNTSIDNVKAVVGGKTITFSEVKRGYLLDLGYCESGQSVKLTAVKSDNDDDTTKDLTFSASAYAFNDEDFVKAYNELAEHQFSLNTFEDSIFSTYVAGTVTAENDGKLFMSIPYDKGWSAYVDGEKVETEGLDDAFLLIPVSAGTHKIELKYVPEGLVYGAIITGASILTFVLCCIVISLRKKSREEELIEDGEVLIEEIEENLEVEEITHEDIPDKEPDIKLEAQEFKSSDKKRRALEDILEELEKKNKGKSQE